MTSEIEKLKEELGELYQFTPNISNKNWTVYTKATDKVMDYIQANYIGIEAIRKLRNGILDESGKTLKTMISVPLICELLDQLLIDNLNSNETNRD